MKRGASLSLTVHPQAEKYHNQNRQLQAELARLIVERDDLKYSVVPHIKAKYQVKLGALEWRVFQMDCEKRAMIRRIEMAQAKLNRDEKPCYKSIESEIETEFSAWREKIKQRAQEIKAAKERKNLPVLSRAESRELQTLYRKLAFLLHPDINKNADERLQKLWLQTTDAYRCGDLQTLRTIRLLAENDVETPLNHSADKSLSILEILKTRQIELKQSCEKLLDEISEIKTTEPFVWHKILDDEVELELRQNILREQIADLREKRLQLTKHWAEIMRFAEDRELVVLPEEPIDIFAGNDDWAEIIYDL
jgi:hypothetical protein